MFEYDKAKQRQFVYLSRNKKREKKEKSSMFILYSTPPIPILNYPLSIASLGGNTFISKLPAREGLDARQPRGRKERERDVNDSKNGDLHQKAKQARTRKEAKSMLARKKQRNATPG